MARTAGLRVWAWADVHWKWMCFAIWVGIVTYCLIARWPAIHWFALSDTDDNIRYVQVKDWLAGQAWSDLRQYRLDPPRGFDIHWSRIVDLPIAALILFFRPFMESGLADRLACAIAPLLPLLLLMLSLAFIVRQLARGPAWMIAALAPLAAQMGLGMFMPLRIDHHGWQLALTVTMLAGVIDPNWRRGGIVAGVASALSVAIGMEMMVYLAAAGGLIALRWVFKDGAVRRMRPYAIALGGSSALLFLIFASVANRQPVCDALSPVWVAILGVAAGGMVLLSLLPLRTWPQRLLAGAAIGAGVGAFAWLNWPQCLSGAYQISPELQRLWLANIREAKPLTAQGMGTVVPLLALPVLGVLGALVACWAGRRDTEKLWAWGTVTLMTLFAVGLLFWQLRAGPAAQLLAIPGAAWLAAALLQGVTRGGWPYRAAGALAALAVASALFAYQLYPQFNRMLAEVTGDVTAPAKPAVAARREAIRKANGRCRALPALQRLDSLPPATIFTMVDLGPRLIATTHHSAVAGPYHRNERAILDIHHAFDGPANAFRAIAERHGATYLLICPNFPEGTVYQSRSPGGFYAQLMRNELPAWLKPVPLDAGKLPFTLYRILYSAKSGKEVAQ